MSLNEKIKWREPKLLAAARGAEKKLKRSLAYRKGEHMVVIPDELGTAEHRPQRGLIYDAPLGLKF
jgi:hypothetical protein